MAQDTASTGTGALGDILGRIGSSEIAGKLIGMMGPAVVQTVLEQLNQQGYGAKVNSWLGRGPNQPITADEIKSALGNAKVQELARSLGLPVDKLTEMLAQSLPAAVDQASKDGTIAAPGS